MKSRGFSSLIALLTVAVAIAVGTYLYIYHHSSQTVPNVASMMHEGETASSTANSPVTTLSPSTDSNSISTDGTLLWEQKTTVFGLSTTTLPHFTHYSDQAVLDKLNAKMDKISHDGSCASNQSELQDFIQYNSTQYSSKQLSSMSPAQVMDLLGIDSVVEGKVVYAKHATLSIILYFDSNCGGAHPNNNTQAITIDLKTGNEITFENLFSNYDSNKDAIANILAKDYDTHLRKNESSQEYEKDDCANMDSLTFIYPTYAVRDSGIEIWPELPHVMQVCARDFPVSFKEIKPYLSKNSIFSGL